MPQRYYVEMWLDGKKLGKKLGQWRRARGPGESLEHFLEELERDYPDSLIDYETAKELKDETHSL